MEAPPRVSGLDLARGLMRMGHRLTGNASGYLLLERGSRAVTVPLLDEIDPVLLRFLVLAAGVSMPQLVSALQPPSALSSPKGLPPPPRASVSIRPLSLH